MKSIYYLPGLLLLLLLFNSCEHSQKEMIKIVFLHHSTGQRIWIGNTNRYIYKLTKKGEVQSLFKKYNRKNKTNYAISDRIFPAASPYGWRNYPYDYYNIWVKNAGDQPFQNEPTLEILIKKYDIIVFKHCFPVSNIGEDSGIPDINSDERTIENYKMQYEALKKKLHDFPNNKFIVWTPAVQVKDHLTEAEAQRTYTFYKWMRDEWDEKGDNIYVWDFYKYETEGELYLKAENAAGVSDSHPGKAFASRMAHVFVDFVIQVAKGEIE